jgi:hypothetical protein
MILNDYNRSEWEIHLVKLKAQEDERSTKEENEGAGFWGAKSRNPGGTG